MMKFVILALLFIIFADGEEIRGRIFNGQDAVPGQFKYVAVVYTRISYDTTLGSLCGGAIIAPNWILTAAHCLEGKVEAAIFLGSIDRNQATVKYTVNQFNFFWHSQYNPVTSWNDIALIKIPTTIECDSIAYARMPHLATSAQAGDKATIMGWGNVGDGAPLPDRLQWAEVEVISNEECRNEFPDLINLEICANTKPQYGATGMGDSGGPLVLRDTKELIGIVSCGPSECSTGKPIIFVRVTSYLTWLTSITGIHFS